MCSGMSFIKTHIWDIILVEVDFFRGHEKFLIKYSSRSKFVGKVSVS